ncbi:MAG TPA: aspartate aminotransferase family protein [Solirubrobacterales bacterium]|nr:aspartate aminotransferase family protein [Solirubrobacterales bacterium]
MALQHRTRLWHPFADMTAVLGHELLLSRAEGVWLWDADGTRYLDATSSLWYANVGHGRERMAEAIAAQIGRLDVYSIFNDFTNEPAEELAERLARLSPIPDARVFLGTGGGDGIESAAKLARLHFSLRGAPERVHVIGRRQGFHGAFAFGTSIGGIEANQSGFGELVRDCSQVEPNSVEALEREIERVGPDRVAAFFFEPVIGAGGVLFPPEGYLAAVAELCRRHGILLVADEVICAFGRLGTWFGVERFDVVPDMIVFAKGVTSGYLPLGGAIVSGKIAEPLWSGEPGHPFRHGATYAGHPTCCVAALTNLDILAEEDLLSRSRALEPSLKAALGSLADRPAVGEVRVGEGLLGAIALDPELLATRPGVTLEVHRAARRRGVMVRPLPDSVAVSPPLIVTEEQIESIAGAIGGALEEVSRASRRPEAVG